MLYKTIFLLLIVYCCLVAEMCIKQIGRLIYQHISLALQMFEISSKLFNSVLIKAGSFASSLYLTLPEVHIVSNNGLCGVFLKASLTPECYRTICTIIRTKQ